MRLGLALARDCYPVPRERPPETLPQKGRDRREGPLPLLAPTRGITGTPLVRFAPHYLSKTNASALTKCLTLKERHPSNKTWAGPSSGG